MPITTNSGCTSAIRSWQTRHDLVERLSITAVKEGGDDKRDVGVLGA